MELAEFYRVRRVLVWDVAITLAIVLPSVLFSGRGGFTIGIDDTTESGQRGVALGNLLLSAMVVATIAASWIGQALNTDPPRLEFLWTRPIARSALAARFIAVDLAALAFVYLFTLAAGWFIGAAQGRVLFVDDNAGAIALLSSGVVAMWYALILLVGAPNGRGGVFAGLLWPLSMVLLVLGLQTGPGLVHSIVLALNLLNPFAYLNVFVHTESGPNLRDGIWHASLGARTVITWLMALLLCALATWVWRRRET